MKSSKMLLAASIMSLFATYAFAENYSLDTKESKIMWKATKKVMGGHHGTVNVKEGSVNVNEKNEVTAGTVIADMSTIASEDLAADKDSHTKFVGHLSSPDFFDVKKYPTSKFDLKSIEKKGADHIAKGDLTFIGQTHPIEFPITMTVDKGVAKGQGTAKIDRTKWGLKYGSGSFLKLPADKIINDEFELSFNLVAKKDEVAAKSAKKK